MFREANYWCPLAVTTEAHVRAELRPILDDTWTVTAEELPCLLDIRVFRTGGRKISKLRGIIELGLPV